MLDIRLIREDPDAVKRALARRGENAARIDEVLVLDVRRREQQTRLDRLRSEQKQGGKMLARLQGDDKQQLLARLKQISDEVAGLEREQAETAEQLRALLLVIPNLPHESVPDGEGEEQNEELRRWGEPVRSDFQARDHLEIGENLDIVDVARAARASGSRFSYLKGAAALLWLGLARYAIDRLGEEGFRPVLPPVLVRREALEGTGFMPGAGEEQIYRIPEDDLYLVGTSEVALAAMHMDEILDESELPLRYVATSSCFRREAGAHGRDVRGILRLHQFEKVEMYVFAHPERSWEEHERLVAIEESVLQALKLPYRAMALSTGDLGRPSAKTVDLETWFPAQSMYREATSCSNTTDYQARRLNVRARGALGPYFVHTLNGTAATSSRHIAAILENYQRADGTVTVPEVLVPYCGVEVIK